MKGTRLFRRLASKVIDAAFIIKSPAGLKSTVVILHGASCSGKSTILKRLKRKYAGCAYVEMDYLQYWKIEADPDILNVAYDLMTDAGLKSERSRELVRSIEQSHSVPKRNSRHRVMVELLKMCLAHDAVITTCGSLPPPDVDNGYYQLLAKCTNKTILHVLLAPDNSVLAKRIRSRGLAGLMERNIASNNRRLQNRAFYDLILTSSESSDRTLELMRESLDKLVSA